MTEEILTETSLTLKRVGSRSTVMENTDAQAGLHPELISEKAHRAIEIARRHDASGWKVNGAGGPGGSLTILYSPRAEAVGEVLESIEQEYPQFRNLPIQLSNDGVIVLDQSN
jgi:D-glycero-alpha-D-manno-heptose-7-phosphate kinase